MIGRPAEPRGSDNSDPIITNNPRPFQPANALLLSVHPTPLQQMPNAKTRTLKLAPVNPDSEIEIAELTRQRVVSPAQLPVGGRPCSGLQQ